VEQDRTPPVQPDLLKWRGQPLTSHEVFVNLIAGTATRTGLKVTAELDETIYPKGIKITDREMPDLETQHLARHDFHGEWNDTVPSNLIPASQTPTYVCP
jgi:hypothetical protein